MGGLSKLLVHKAVLPSQCLDIFSELCNFASLQLRQLCLLLEILSKGHHFRLQQLYLLFPLEELSLEVVFFASCYTHLVLHIAEF